jgi:sugar phosphate isomerase/epimerase
MLISTQTAGFAAKFGDHDAIKLLANIGYDALDYSMFDLLSADCPLNKDDYRGYAKSLKKTANENNIKFNQSHAPFPSYIQYPNENQTKIGYNEIIIPAIVRSMEVTSIIGGKIVIVHPVTLTGVGYEEQKDFNMELFNSLLPWCKKFDVKIALENMWGWDAEAKKVTPAACSVSAEFIDYLDSLDKNWFCACLDLGHAEMQGSGSVSAAEFIYALGNERLYALHVHDNDKIGDLHTLPFTRKINWEVIIKALKDIGYSGEFTFEADNFITGFPAELYMSASKLMLDVGRYMCEII